MAKRKHRYFRQVWPELDEISICVDCLFYHANGDVPETWRSCSSDNNEDDDGNPEASEAQGARFVRAIEANWPNIEAIFPGDEQGFSWHECDSCGSTLGGDRYTAYVRPKGYGPRSFARCNPRRTPTEAYAYRLGCAAGKAERGVPNARRAYDGKPDAYSRGYVVGWRELNEQ